MLSRPPGRLIVLPISPARQEQLRQQQALRLRKRKVKIVVAGACLTGLLVSFLAIALEPTESAPGDDSDALAGDESPFQPSRGGSRDSGEGPAWFTTVGGGRASDGR